MWLVGVHRTINPRRLKESAQSLWDRYVALGHLSPDLNTLGNDIIEALECLKARWDNGLARGR